MRKVNGRDMLTLTEVATATGASRGAIRRIVEDDAIPHERSSGGGHIYFEPDDLEKVREAVSAERD